MQDAKNGTTKLKNFILNRNVHNFTYLHLRLIKKSIVTC